MNFSDFNSVIGGFQRPKLSFSVVFFLLDNCDDMGVFRGSRAAVGESLGLAESGIKNVSHALRELKEAGLIVVNYEAGGNVYESPGKGRELHIKLKPNIKKLFL